MSTKELQNHLNKIRTLKLDIEKYCLVDELNKDFIKQSSDKKHLCNLINKLARHVNLTAQLLSDTGGRGTVSLKSVSDDDRRFYKDYIKPNSSHIKTLGEYCSDPDIYDSIDEFFPI